MDYRALGRTGLKISRLCLGCGNFGGVGSAPAFWGMGDTEAQAATLMDRAWDAGLTVFDTADAYGGGRSETFIGNWLADKGTHVRDQLVLTTKVFNPVGSGVNQRGLSRVHILRQIDASLARLRTDRVDLYLMHEVDVETPIDETLEALDDLRRAGKVLYVGASNISAWRLATALGVSTSRRLVQFCEVQNSYSLLDRGAERELLPLCADAGVGFTAYSPLAGGWLTGKYRRDDPFPEGSRMTLRPEPYRHLQTDAIFDGLNALAADARARGVASGTLALAWVLARPHVDAAIIGARKASHLDEALAALDVTLTPDDVDRLARVFDRTSP
jgi:aryl-alcohol dehydrogenase-like predicted oxidoreductase